MNSLATFCQCLKLAQWHTRLDCEEEDNRVLSKWKQIYLNWFY